MLAWTDNVYRTPGSGTISYIFKGRKPTQHMHQIDKVSFMSAGRKCLKQVLQNHKNSPVYTLELKQSVKKCRFISRQFNGQNIFPKEISFDQPSTCSRFRVHQVMAKRGLLNTYIVWCNDEIPHSNIGWDIVKNIVCITNRVIFLRQEYPETTVQ